MLQQKKIKRKSILILLILSSRINLIYEKKGKELFMPIRAAITGQTNGPELDRVVELIGIDRVQSRLKEASEL